MSKMKYRQAGYWSTDEYEAGFEEFEREFFLKVVLDPDYDYENKKTNNKKFALIDTPRGRDLAFVDNVTMIAYGVDESYECTNIEIKDCKFVRWCTSMDL